MPLAALPDEIDREFALASVLVDPSHEFDELPTFRGLILYVLLQPRVEERDERLVPFKLSSLPLFVQPDVPLDRSIRHLPTPSTFRCPSALKAAKDVGHRDPESGDDVLAIEGLVPTQLNGRLPQPVNGDRSPERTNVPNHSRTGTQKASDLLGHIAGFIGNRLDLHRQIGRARKILLKIVTARDSLPSNERNVRRNHRLALPRDREPESTVRAEEDAQVTSIHVLEKVTIDAGANATRFTETRAHLAQLPVDELIRSIRPHRGQIRGGVKPCRNHGPIPRTQTTARCRTEGACGGRSGSHCTIPCLFIAHRQSLLGRLANIRSFSHAVF
ncbi:MAG TPA: hypothetical protein VH482_22980 [Thermomicrobiales bacterium]|jgi:hypothetical protein